MCAHGKTLNSGAAGPRRRRGLPCPLVPPRARAVTRTPSRVRRRGGEGVRKREAGRLSCPSSAKGPRLDRLEAHPRRGCSAGRRRRRREPALPHAVPGQLSPHPSPPAAATDLASRRGRAIRRPAGPCPGRALGGEGRGARRKPVPPGSAGHMTWCGRGAPSGAPRPPTPSRAAAWPGGGAAAERPPGAARTQAPLPRRAARGRPGVWFLPAEEGGLWGGSRYREPPPRSRRG